MSDFHRLCKIIIDRNGQPTMQDVLDCGYSKENFIRISQSNIKADRLIKNARQALLDRGIHYKEK